MSSLLRVLLLFLTLQNYISPCSAKILGFKDAYVYGVAGGVVLFLTVWFVLVCYWGKCCCFRPKRAALQTIPMQSLVNNHQKRRESTPPEFERINSDLPLVDPLSHDFSPAQRPLPAIPPSNPEDSRKPLTVANGWMGPPEKQGNPMLRADPNMPEQDRRAAPFAYESFDPPKQKNHTSPPPQGDAVSTRPKYSYEPFNPRVDLIPPPVAPPRPSVHQHPLNESHERTLDQPNSNLDTPSTLSKPSVPRYEPFNPRVEPIPPPRPSLESIHSNHSGHKLADPSAMNSNPPHDYINESFHQRLAMDSSNTINNSHSAEKNTPHPSENPSSKPAHEYINESFHQMLNASKTSSKYPEPPVAPPRPSLGQTHPEEPRYVNESFHNRSQNSSMKRQSSGEPLYASEDSLPSIQNRRKEDPPANSSFKAPPPINRSNKIIPHDVLTRIRKNVGTDSSVSSTNPAASWDETQVQLWLESQGMDFETRKCLSGVTGAELLQLTKKDLEDLGIKVAPRIKLAQSIKTLVSNDPASFVEPPAQQDRRPGENDAMFVAQELSLREHLLRIGLLQYQDVLEREGIDDLKTLYSYSPEELKALGIKGGHAKKLLFFSPENENPASDALVRKASANRNLSNGKDWLFPREQLTLGKRLGEGAFGDVLYGEARAIIQGVPFSPVAVKCMKPGATTQDKDDFLLEISLMQTVGSHPHVVALLGICIAEDPMLMIVEFMSGGSLRDALRSSRPDAPSRKPISDGQLLVYAMHISAGMSFLAGRKFIHRDLATRNVLIDGKVAKIADFGLTRVKDQEDIYSVRTRARRLPTKWLAPESLKEGIFSSMTDVWAYGVVLWEIVMLGHVPYPGLDAMKVFDLITNEHYRMPKPPSCSHTYNQLMRDCWSEKPETRPTFDEIFERIEEMIESKRPHIVIADFVPPDPNAQIQDMQAESSDSNYEDEDEVEEGEDRPTNPSLKPPRLQGLRGDSFTEDSDTPHEYARTQDQVPTLKRNTQPLPIAYTTEHIVPQIDKIVEEEEELKASQKPENNDEEEDNDYEYDDAPAARPNGDSGGLLSLQDTFNEALRLPAESSSDPSATLRRQKLVMGVTDSVSFDESSKPETEEQPKHSYVNVPNAALPTEQLSDDEQQDPELPRITISSSRDQLDRPTEPLFEAPPHEYVNVNRPSDPSIKQESFSSSESEDDEKEAKPELSENPNSEAPARENLVAPRSNVPDYNKILPHDWDRPRSLLAQDSLEEDPRAKNFRVTKQFSDPAEDENSADDDFDQQPSSLKPHSENASRLIGELAFDKADQSQSPSSALFERRPASFKKYVDEKRFDSLQEEKDPDGNDNIEPHDEQQLPSRPSLQHHHFVDHVEEDQPPASPLPDLPSNIDVTLTSDPPSHSKFPDSEGNPDQSSDNGSQNDLMRLPSPAPEEENLVSNDEPEPRFDDPSQPLQSDSSSSPPMVGTDDLSLRPPPLPSSSGPSPRLSLSQSSPPSPVPDQNEENPYNALIPPRPMRNLDPPLNLIPAPADFEGVNGTEDEFVFDGDVSLNPQALREDSFRDRLGTSGGDPLSRAILPPQVDFLE